MSNYSKQVFHTKLVYIIHQCERSLPTEIFS